MREHTFTTYVRTKMVFNHRLKGLRTYDRVKIHMYELRKLYVDTALLERLRGNGEIEYDQRGNFRACKDGPIDPSLLKVTKRRDKLTNAPLTTLHLYMRNQLMGVELEDVSPSDISVYFKAFLDHRSRDIEPFFTVDGFSGRVHTPIVNLKHDLRSKLTLFGEPVISLDVKQMQPTILAKILKVCVGPNAFSNELFSGSDVYVILQKAAGLPTRAEAKTFLFKLIFGKPMNDIGMIFRGDTSWVDWINNYKRRIEPRNPHSEATHTNLAWLLQYSEVRVMSDIWNELMTRKIPFLTIHDDVLCRESDRDEVHAVMDAELRQHFPRYSITVT